MDQAQLTALVVETVRAALAQSSVEPRAHLAQDQASPVEQKEPVVLSSQDLRPGKNVKRRKRKKKGKKKLQKDVVLPSFQAFPPSTGVPPPQVTIPELYYNMGGVRSAAAATTTATTAFAAAAAGADDATLGDHDSDSWSSSFSSGDEGRPAAKQLFPGVSHTRPEATEAEAKRLAHSFLTGIQNTDGNVRNFVKNTPWKEPRNHREAKVLAEAISLLLEGHNALAGEFLLRRLCGLHQADMTKNWTLCEQLMMPPRPLVPMDIMNRALRKSALIDKQREQLAQKSWSKSKPSPPAAKGGGKS